MGKTKFSIKPVVKYLRELSIVVLGVAITVSLGVWVNNKNNEKDLKEHLLAVKTELEENAKKFDRYALWLQKSVKYADYLKANEGKNLNKDSLIYYGHSLSYYYDFESSGEGCGYKNTRSLTTIFTTNAFDMLKLSGITRQMKNKELLLSVLDTYTKIEEVKVNIDQCFKKKEDESNKENQWLAEGKQIDIPMKIFYSIDDAPLRMVIWCEELAEEIKETVSKMEDAKILSD